MMIQASRQPSKPNRSTSWSIYKNTAKLNSEVLTLWRKILKKVDDCRLILKWKTMADEPYRDNIKAFFAEDGIASDRLELHQFSSPRRAPFDYGSVDIALDPFPFTGGLTSLEALWMGVPVITLPGERVVSRQTYSFLACIDALELVAHDQGHDVELAVELAGDRERLHRYRQELRPRMEASLLCQPGPFAEQFTTLLEQAYATIEQEPRTVLQLP